MCSPDAGGGGARWSARSPSNDSGSAASGAPRSADGSSGWRMPSASVCGDAATSRDVGDGSRRHAGGAERSCQFAVSSRREPLLEERDERVAVARRDRSSSRTAGRRRAPGRPSDVADRAEQPVVAACDHQLAVPRREHLVRRDHREARPLAASGSSRRRGSRRGGSRCSRARSRRARRRPRSPHRSARARAARRGRRAPPRCPCPGRSATSRRGRRAARLARHRDEPAGGLHQRVVAGLPRRAGRCGRTRRPSSRRAAGCARAGRPGRGRARSASPGGGSGGRRRLGRRGGGSRRGRAGRAARARASACPRWPRGTSSPRRSRTAGPRRAPSSPVSGRSTLTTSAPSAARICAQYGPAIDVVTSSTRVPVERRRCTSPHHRRAHVSARMHVVFDAVQSTGSPGTWWSYVVIFAVAVLDAFFPLVPSETVVIVAAPRRERATSSCSS